MGGKEQNSPIYISRIIPGGIADRFTIKIDYKYNKIDIECEDKDIFIINQRCS